MAWRLGKKKRSREQRFRPILLLLEGRVVPSVAVTQFTDLGGAAGLRVTADGRNDTLAITDNSTNHTTTVVANDVTVTLANQFTLFDLELTVKKDALTFDFVGALDHEQADVQVSLGKGENHFTFNPSLTAIDNHSDLNLNVRGHDGNDFVNLSFGDILESRVNVAASHLGGSKGRADSTTPRDSITFGTLRAGIRNSSVDVNVGLGTGTNNLAFNYGSDLGHLASSGDPAPGDFGPSTFNVNITGGSGRRDVANVTLFANGEGNTGSTLNFNVQFLAGNNSFNGVIDASQFQIDDDGGEFISDAHLGGAAHFNVRGGSGNDTISFQSINQDSTIDLSGLLDINIQGGSGKNTINVDFGAGSTNTGGFLDDDPIELRATNRSFRLRINGGTPATQSTSTWPTARPPLLVMMSRFWAAATSSPSRVPIIMIPPLAPVPPSVQRGLSRLTAATVPTWPRSPATSRSGPSTSNW